MPIMKATQSNREVSIHCALEDDVLLFQELHGNEQLGRLFEFRVQMLSHKDDVKIADVLGKGLTVTIDLPGGGQRHLNGLVTRFCNNGWRGKFASYEAVIHPWLWLLTRSSDCRIFQDMTALDIVKQVCGNAVYGSAVNLDAGQLSGTCAVRTYCVQYRETDFNFVCRLLEEEGIYYYFTHEQDRHTMVLADSYGAHAPIEGYEALAFRGEETPGASDESVSAWAPAGHIQSSVYVLDDFDFEKAAASTSGALRVKATVAAAFEQPSYEHYDYPGRYVKSGDGTAFARGRMEAIHGQCEQIAGRCNARALAPGGLFALAEHPREDQNREYLVTGARLDVIGHDYWSGASAQSGMLFGCAFTAVGKEHSYRAPAITPKPIVQGPQTAMVVGKAGEEVWTDKYGRIKVQFHWDRVGKEDENSSCWVRVAQGWAGKGWGAMFIPRIGMEVVVEFLEGDPDRPLVTGCVYNGDALPPYPLPDEQTKSTIMSNTSKGGGGYNEIRFEDKQDAQEIYVQAEKDFKRVVKNNDVLKVGFEKADKGDQTIDIKHDQSVDIGNDQNLHVVANQTVKIDGDQSVKIGKTCVIEAQTSIELKVGGSSIKIEPAKITIKTAQVAVEADATIEIKAGATMQLKATAPMTIEGAIVKIN